MEQTPWIDTSKIRVGPIGPEERKAIDAQLVRLLAAHRSGRGRSEAPRTVARCVWGGDEAEAQGQVQSRARCTTESLQRRAQRRRPRSQAEEAANGPDQIEVRFLEAYAAGVVAPSDLAAV